MVLQLLLIAIVVLVYAAITAAAGTVSALSIVSFLQSLISRCQYLCYNLLHAVLQAFNELLGVVRRRPTVHLCAAVYQVQLSICS
jgi:hypothetical protein